jgi:hypothetical protein
MKKSDLHKHIKETILSKLSENYKDKIGDSKYGDTLELFDEMRKTIGDAKTLDRILNADINILEDLYDSMTFQKQDMEESATEDDVESQKKYNDELERTNQLQKDMGMAESKKKA